MTDISSYGAEVPGLLRKSLYAILVVSGCASVFSLGGYSPLPVNELLDAWLISFICVSVWVGRIRHTMIILFLVAYLVTRVAAAVANDSPVPDFLQAYRWLLYLIAFVIALHRSWGPLLPMIKVMWVLISLGLVKTILTIAILGPSQRSGLLTENNFELALYCALAAGLLSRLTGRQQVWTLLALGALVMSSGSRSGAVEFGLLIIYAVINVARARVAVRLLLVIVVPVIVYFVSDVFAARAESGGVDRLNFLSVFLGETANWNLLDWLWGTSPITPLSSGGCAAMEYYSSLFSSTGDGTCYSVVLHAFIMRVVYDAGLFGLFLTVFVVLFSLRRSGAGVRVTWTIFAIAFANGFSVSGLNSPYVALPIVLTICISANRGSVESFKPHKGVGLRGEWVRNPERFDGHDSPSSMRPEPER
ncbi:hypothetical protein SA2016_2880 [Sinomonas atrocyanea]|uniref:Uncharacterized protein n=1 Tax=Sinomonas atrocyanea TaxID=37927 RepID=A0A127A4H7_9MICC|nr:hypothetical protein SA2016_2880 [Sinomonas atrocyanea]GEB66302.1 hypothetical protein SAT01_37500 [Sinomonas atrocyanea]GGG77903.1 hypothetical protein GCM10007172_33650 [Sinomonas atrocyanea]